jgi:hypothetical protein
LSPSFSQALLSNPLLVQSLGSTSSSSTTHRPCQLIQHQCYSWINFPLSIYIHNNWFIVLACTEAGWLVKAKNTWLTWEVKKKNKRDAGQKHMGMENSVILIDPAVRFMLMTDFSDQHMRMTEFSITHMFWAFVPLGFCNMDCNQVFSWSCIAQKSL